MYVLLNLNFEFEFEQNDINAITVDSDLSGHLCSQADCPDKWVKFCSHNMCLDKWGFTVIFCSVLLSDAMSSKHLIKLPVGAENCKYLLAQENMKSLIVKRCFSKGHQLFTLCDVLIIKYFVSYIYIRKSLSLVILYIDFMFKKNFG